MIHFNGTVIINRFLCRFKNKMLWNPENIDEYREPLQQPVIVEKLRNFTASEFVDSDEAADGFTSILNCVLETVFPKKKHRKSKDGPKRKQNYSHACQMAKRAFNRAQKHFSRDKTNLNRRHQFIIARRDYRKAIYIYKKTVKRKQN